MKHIIFSLMLVLPLSSCTDEPTATRILSQEGYEEITLTGYQWLACGRDDFFHTGFVAIKNNKAIEGTVCSGLFFKNATIRYK